jgi:pyruvate formate-lyase activating enzyme-like uncharacterized protein
VNRFDVNKVTTPEQARKNIGMNSPTEKTVTAMMKQMEEDKWAVVHLCKKEILDMVQLGSRICNMTYKSKFTDTGVICLEPTHMRISWMEDSGEVNIKRIC